MPTKLSRYCEGIMEAVWLAALAVVPIFFNVYSSRIFEPDKLSLLRSLALVALGAWVVKLLDQGADQWERKEGEAWFKSLLRVPLIPQVLLLVGVYLLATVFSVTPRISFWGSYQRLQGTYTTLSYIVIFAALAGNLRRKEQVDRLIITAILSSLPVGLYGILQRFQIDPVPWGGDVSRRIAANMGNSIFVAAYLIIAFPLTLGKIVDSFSAILKEDENAAAHVARGTIYVFTAAIQLIAIYLSGSRGPLLGLLSGSFFFLLALSLYWGKRWLTWGTIGSAAAVGAFLIVFSIPNGPLASLQSRSGLGRLGNVFDVDSGTGLVRVLIWKGAAQLVAPHEPLKYPDGRQDRFNVLRPLIGYGPESMYVAYNSFYPPELANIESRNASPDRSHNETWDSLVITGFVGLFTYLALFTSIFYYGLKWLGMIATSKQRNLFLGLVLGGGVVSAAGFVYWGEVGFFGVGLPFGMLMGLLLYLALISLFAKYTPPQTEGSRLRALTLMMVLAAIIGHFVEIHFGIAIAATRTYFWILSGLLLAVGYYLTGHGVYGKIEASHTEGESRLGEESPPRVRPTGKRQKRRNSSRGGRASRRSLPPSWRRYAVIGGIITAIVLSTLGYDFISNQNTPSTIQIVWKSFTTLPNRDFQTSYGVLSMLVTLWLAAGVLFTAENPETRRETWLPALGTTLGISAVISLFFWLFHAGGLVTLLRVAGNQDIDGLTRILTQADILEGFLTRYYVFLFLLLLALAWFLPLEWPAKGARKPNLSLVAAPVALLIVLSLANFTNLRIIHADTAFKMAEPFGRGNQPDQWRVAIELYKRAQEYDPAQDHYYLFLGRGYLELARLLYPQNPQEGEQLLREARDVLERAQKINPLNTDHTANLARLHRFWASLVSDPQRRSKLAQKASDYYARAVELSPNNVVLWNEWAVLHLNQLNQPEKALEILNRSVEIDPFFHNTYAILAEYYTAFGAKSEDKAEKERALEQAAGYYQEAIARVKKKRESGTKFNYTMALGSVYGELQDYENAIATYQQALEIARPKQVWQVEEALARVYALAGDKASALVHANIALANAPENQKPRVQELINFLQQQNP